LGQFNRLEDIAQKSQDEIYVPTEANVKAISNTQYLVRADTETIKSIAENYRISPEVLKRFNPGLKDDVAKGNILMIPNSDQIKADGHLILEISQKDDFAKMADSYGISKAELIQFNPALANGVNQGDNILIPSNDELSSSDKGFAHNSEEGDNWYLVAEKYGISVEDLKRFNPNFDDELVADQLVFIPSKELLSKSSNQTYVTKKGDTFEGIKEIYHVSQEELIAFNPNNIDELEEGTNLLIPSSSQIKTTGTLWQTTQKGDSKSNLAKMAKISVTDIEAFNPQLKTRDVKEGEAVLIPSFSLLKSNEDYQYNVQEGDDFEIISKILGLDMEQLKSANPEIVDPKPGDNLTMPGQKSTLAVNEEQQEKDSIGYINRVTLEGISKEDREHIQKLAYKHNVDVAVITKFNEIKGISSKEETQLFIPNKEHIDAVHNFEHIVRSSEQSILEIAEIYGLSEQEIRNFNPRLKDKVYRGDIVLIPSKEQISAKGHFMHVIQKGDDWETIAELYGIKKKDLIAFNPIEEKELAAHTKLILPSKEELNVGGGIKHVAGESDTWKSIAEKNNITAQALRAYNPNLTEIKKGDILFIPSINQVTANHNLKYKAKKGDTWEKIANIYHLDEEDLVHFNPHLKNGIHVEDIILIPTNDQMDLATNHWHVNKAGETIESIASRYGLTKEDIIAFNPHHSTELGHEILIPNYALLRTQKDYRYTAQKGETFETLTKAFNMSKAEILAFNPDMDTNIVQGQKIRIPSVEEVASLGQVATNEKTEFDKEKLKEEQALAAKEAEEAKLLAKSEVDKTENKEVPEAISTADSTNVVKESESESKEIEKTAPAELDKEYIEKIAQKLDVKVETIEKYNTPEVLAKKQDDIIFIPSEEQKESIWNLRHVVKRDESLTSIAKRYGISPYDLRNFNPTIGETVKEGDVLLVLSEEQIEGADRFYHHFKKGESLKEIAARFNLTEKDLIRFNPLAEVTLEDGDRLVIPSLDELAAEQGEQLDVKNKKSLMKELDKRGIAMHVIERYNPNINFDDLKGNEKIYIPSKDEQSRLSNRTHIVKSYENLTSIATTYGISKKVLIEFNPHITKEKIPEFTKILIPSAQQIENSNNHWVTVKEETDLNQFAAKYELKGKDLLEVNPSMDKMSSLKPGIKVLIPSKNLLRSEGKYFYAVQENESFVTLSKEFGIEKNDLLTFNLDADTSLVKGEELFIPNQQQIKATKHLAVVGKYVVQPDDDLESIANKTELNVEDILVYNPKAEENLKEGNVLIVPKTSFSGLSAIPPRIAFADYNGNGFIEVNEVYKVIDQYFDFEINVDARLITQIIEYFFEQPSKDN
jgi:LysM repeat protein